MSIASEITRLGGNISDSFSAVSAMGGTVPSGATSDNLEAAIRSIPQSGGGGTSLPSVTSADNDKVLTVVNGAWDKASRDNIVWVDCLLDLSNMRVSNGSKTYQQCQELFEAGKMPMLRVQFYIAQNLYQYGIGQLDLTPGNVYGSADFVWNMFVFADLGSGLALYHFTIAFMYNGNITCKLNSVSYTAVVS